MKTSLLNVIRAIAKKENAIVSISDDTYALYGIHKGWIGACSKGGGNVQGVLENYEIAWKDECGWYSEGYFRVNNINL